MTQAIRRLVLFAYLLAVGYFLLALLVLVLKGKITADEYLTQTALVIASLAALLIKTEPPSPTTIEQMDVSGEEVSVTEQPKKGKTPRS